MDTLKDNAANNGPLSGVTIVEMVGIGPGPFAGMMLADMGARVIAVDKGTAGIPKDINRRGKESILLDLKSEAGREILFKLVQKADAIFEGFRPGVMEKLGLSPDTLQGLNPALVYGRMTGWGQEGPIAHTAGHDITYIARSGVLGSLGIKGEAPTAPLNLIGDYGGGALFLIAGILAGIIDAKTSGKGRVIDAAMVDGSALLMSLFTSFAASGVWSGKRGETMLSGHAPFYGTYETSDGGYMAVGPIEPQFAKVFYDKLGLSELMPRHMNFADWPDMRAQIASMFKSKTRDEWTNLFEGTEACVSPVLSYHEAAEDPHMTAREIYRDIDGIVQPAPAPRFSDYEPHVGPITQPGTHSQSLLEELGYSKSEIAALKDNKTI